MKNLDDLSGVLTTDITYIQLMNRDWVYLATVYDPEKRRVVSYGLSSEMTKEFATSVVVKALRANGKTATWEASTLQVCSKERCKTLG